MGISDKFKHGDLVYINNVARIGKVIAPSKLVSKKEKKRVEYLTTMLRVVEYQYVLIQYENGIEFYKEDIVKAVPYAAKVLYGKV